ncbi:hypothetical protein PtA15_10A528 [Puccinia triticina]|uniref:Uncharacterized protein n=1 Tax=Puccinia triticina TaxID=208348 RepID=A0ABY7CV02_9BASI|nr:uncharacterized protein PtA15_10A528 [Puccinia triticina]WAQ89104.1 hypothetical protein PtA15_10A528 [Puccinia triticina]
MHPEDHQPPSDPFRDIFCSAIQSAIERVLVEGTRHGIDLKALDKLVDKNAEQLSQDPSSSRLQAEKTLKIAARDESLKAIEGLAIGIAADLHSKLSHEKNASLLQQGASGGRNPAWLCKAEPDSSLERAEACKLQPAVDLANDLKILHKRIGKHAHEVERIDCEHQVAIDGLHQQIGAHKEAIQTLRQLLPEPSPSRSAAAAALDDHQKSTCSNETAPPINRPKSADRAASSHTDHQLVELREELDRMDRRVSELKSSVQTILTKEIPVNLHQSVQFMQQDVNATVQSALTSGHDRLAQLIRDFIARFEPRILQLEQLAAKQIPNFPSLTPTRAAPPNSTTADPDPTRLLLRRPTAQSPDPKLFSEDESEKCNQQ